MTYAFKGNTKAKSITPKSVKFHKAFPVGDVLTIERGSIIDLSGVKHIVTTVRKVELGPVLIRVYGKAEVLV